MIVRAWLGALALAALSLAVVPGQARADAAGVPAPTSERLCSPRPTAGFRTCFGMWRTDVHQPAADAAARSGTTEVAAPRPEGYGPADLRAAYRLPSSGSGVTVAVVDAFDDPNAESDLAVYRASFGLPPCTSANGCFRKVNQNGLAGPWPAADKGWAGEISLDLDMVSAICPSCRLLLVEANSVSADDFGTAVARAALSGAAVINNSYGGPEDGHEAQYDAKYYYHPGIAVVASTGDDGYAAAYPATSAYVLAVGGTKLSRGASPRGWLESAWTGGGAGCSGDEPRPSFQRNLNTGCATRATADVSAVADPKTGVAGYDSYQKDGWQVYGGTSVAAPIVAGIFGLVGGVAPGTQANVLPYLHPGALFDVSTGRDGPCDEPQLCVAAFGYDQPTGLGTPNGFGAFTSSVNP